MRKNTWFRTLSMLALALVAALAVRAVPKDSVSAPLDPAPTTKPKPASVTLVSSAQPAAVLDVSLRNEVVAAVNRALDWLAAQQNPNGSWSNENFPALTAFATRAFIHSSHPKKAEAVGKGIRHILSCRQPDGGIYRNVEGVKGGGLSNYNTAICMMALHAAGDKAYTQDILNARKFIAGSQILSGDDVYKGGFGYDRKTDRAYTDLLNTYYAAVAMKETADVEDLRGKGEKRVDIDWGETVKYVSKMQNPPEAGAAQKGGFFYKPGESKAGALTNETGVVVLRSFGSMTYSGLLALIYANVSKDDARVRSAFDWAAKHWTLEENPGMGAQGLFFFYNVLTKSLTAFGADMIPAKDGKLVNWREELAKKLVGSQKIDPKTGAGYWVNAENRYWENDAVLVTAYSALALEMLQ
ncbi:MAG: terpene cyclase/mutase family protein [Verrucomicrobiota bacterium]|nr:terpene cyclase/mutase family protein [Verrucomicrobiota bacterium]